MSRKRNIQVIFWVSEKEHDLIEEKMAQLGTENMSAYLRKIAIDGYIVKLDLPELREMVSLLRRTSNNVNQLAKRMNETGRVYAADMDDILQNQERLWQAANDIITRLATIK
ncbi:MAG: plasmid mobilization relaxosome protein MobC [Oscillospiraceae bacterium]|nr:plasmid mobilization relaxosome protein MobC [Oscillospiraceae bacterium]